MTDFEKWWHETGSGIAPMPFQDPEEHAKLVAQRAWDATSDPIDQLLLDELWERRTDAAEANARIRQLLGNTEQLRRERDEARKMKHPYEPNGVITIADNLRLRAEVDQLRAERDGARRWVCQAGLFSLKMAKEVAIRRGWDCFKEEETRNA